MRVGRESPKLSYPVHPNNPGTVPSMEEGLSISISDGIVPSPYKLLFQAFLTIPTSHYWIALALLFVVFLYDFLECHLIQDILTGFRGQRVSLTFNSDSQIYKEVVAKCRVLHGRYLVTPWLASPHVQTLFLTFFGRPPAFSYRRKIFHCSDGGTIALDWLISADVLGGGLYVTNDVSKDDHTPIVVVIPGLTSDSESPYIKHLAYNTVKRGWNVVVSNHRGLGGVSVTTDCFYNAGWTEDLREVVLYIHNEFQNAPIFLVGTSIGANVLVKYLGEEGDGTPIAGAVSVCSPWDLLIGDRFIGRRLVQKLYDRALAIGLQGYAQLHQPRFSRLANWDGIKKSRSIRDFDNHATCILGNYETVDTYYRRNSSTNYLGNVIVPLLCISALDDPVCTREAIPWDECRLNKNIVLATTKRGGHLAFFEGITASSLWWVRAANDFLGVLHSSTRMHRQKKTLVHGLHSPFTSSIDQGPYVNFAQDGTVAAAGNELARHNAVGSADKQGDLMNNKDQQQHGEATEEKSDPIPTSEERQKQEEEANGDGGVSLIRRRVDQLSLRTRRSTWLLVYIAVVTTWPVAGSALYLFLRKIRKVPAPAVNRR